MTKMGKYVRCVADLRSTMKESIKGAILHSHNLELAKPYWEKATMAADEYADIGEDDPRCKEKDSIIMQKFELNVENRRKRRQKYEAQEVAMAEKNIKYIEKRKEVLSLIESKLGEKKDIAHLITVRQLRKLLLDNGDMDSYRASKVLHAAARKTVTWYNSMLAVKGVEKEIDKAADTCTLKTIIDFLKREDIPRNNYCGYCVKHYKV